ncbi:MAG: FAD-dependent tricarballylate dehydrogenase TcuA [Candidatus Acidiferrales bacterium]
MDAKQLPSLTKERASDILVAGGGNAALCAAMAARERGASVLLLERAPEHMRAGNTRHTRNIRCVRVADGSGSSGVYSEEEFLEDLMQVTGSPPNMDLARRTIRESRSLPQWMSEHGVSWQEPLAGTLNLGRTNRWFLGGGKALANTYYQRAIEMGVQVCYDAFVEDLVIENGNFQAAVINVASAQREIGARAVVVATGGFEANLGWLKRLWGEAADNFIVRGTPYNDGTLLAKLLEKGANPIGDPKGFHAVAVDARAPKFDGGIVTRLDAIPFGIVVNRQGRRFYDEGENIWPKRYASWGRLIAEQPGQIAYCIVDSKTIHSFLPPMYKPFCAGTIQSLAKMLDVDTNVFSQTVEDFNRATAGNADSRMERLDGLSSRELQPPKSNWAIPLDAPPFYGLPLRPGITFTYMGLTIDDRSRIVERTGRPFKNVFAAGEIMSGNILTKGYLAGFGMTIGSVSGKLAGEEAANYARS